MITSIILTAYVVAMAFAAAMRAKGLQRYRDSAFGRRQIKSEFWAFGRWATALALLPILVNRLLEVYL